MKNHNYKSSYLALLFSLAILGNGEAVQPVVLKPIGDRVIATNSSLPIDLSQFFKADSATNLVRVTTSLTNSNGAPLGFTLQLLPTNAPKTVENFLAYVNDGAYEGMLVHRLATNFVVQTGGFTFSAANPLPIATYPPVTNEFSLSNTRGTVAMAKTANNPNSATSQWFVNLGDNSFNLDNQNGGFTVFARVVGDGMTNTVDKIAKIDPVNLTNYFLNQSLTYTNLLGYYFVFDSVPVTNNTLVGITRVATIPYFALSSDSSAYALRISNSTLTINYTGGGNPPANPVTIGVYATDSNGLTTNNIFKVWHRTNATPTVDYIDKISYSTNSIYNYLYYPTLPDGTRITNVLFSWTPGLINTNKNYSISGIGTLTVTAISPSTLFYKATSNDFKIRIAYDQSINFPKLSTNSSNTMTFTTNSIPLKATSSSKLPVSYTVSGPGRISSTNLYLTGSGTISVIAHQSGNSNYFAATSVTNTLLIQKASQTITFPTIPNQYVAGTIPLKARASSDLPITYRIVSGTNATLTSAPGIKITSRGSYSVVASQAGNAGYLPATPVTNSFQYRLQQSLTSFQKVNSYTYTNNPPISFRVTVPTTTAKTSTNVILTATGPASVSGNSLITITGAGTVTLTATQSGDDVYFPASVSTSFTVEKAPQKISPFTSGTPKTNGMPPFSVAIPSINSQNPVLVRASGAGYVSGTNGSNVIITLTNAGTVTLTASQSGNSNYLAASPVTNVISVAKGNQSIVFSETDHQIGDLVELSAYSTNATGLRTGLPVTYQVTSSPEIGYLTNASEIQTVGIGTITVVASQNGSSGYNAAPPVTIRFAVTLTNSTTNSTLGSQGTGGTLSGSGGSLTMGQGNPTPYYPPVVTNGSTSGN